VTRTQIPKARALAMLADAPKRIAALTASLTAKQLRTPPRAGEWSANEVLAHLRACADVRGGAIVAILAARHPTFRAVDPRAWMERTDYPDLQFAPSLRAFTRQRAALVGLLEPLPEKGWARSATVTGAGAPLERDVHFYAQWVARHERPHLKQIARIAEALRE